MRSLIESAVKNPMVVNVTVIAILVIGLMITFTTRRDIFPDLQIDIIIINVPFPGASAEEVEEGVTIKIEEAIQGVNGIDYITSSSSEGVAGVVVYLRTDVEDPRKVLDDVKDKVDAIFTFPEDAEEPIVRMAENWTGVIAVSVFGQVDDLTIKTLVEDVRDELLKRPEISKISVSGVRPLELTINISEESMRRYNLTFNEISTAVRNYDFDVSGGTIKTDVEELSLRAFGRNYRAEELAVVPLRSLPDGTKVLLRDVANVEQQFAEENYRFRYNGMPGAMLFVETTSKEDALKVTDAVKEYVDEKKLTMPEGVNLEYFFDRSKILNQRIQLLMKNAKYAVALVFMILLIFLGARLSFWVAAGMPVALMGTMILLRTQDVTINMMSLFAFITVLGILVDDAIVVGENVQQQIEAGERPLKAAIEGTVQVYPAVTASVLTTIAAFSPFFMIEGVWGKFLFPVAAVSSFGLLVSLFESVLILPSHLAHSLRPIEVQRADKSWGGRLRNKMDAGIRALINRTYKPVLRLTLKFRWQVFAMGFALFILALGFVASGKIKFVFFPNIDGDMITVEYTLEPGSSMEVQERVSNHILSKVPQLNEEFKEERAEFLKAPAGSKYRKKANPDEEFVKLNVAVEGGTFSGGSNPDVGIIQLELIDGEARGISSQDVADRFRELIGEVPGVIRWNFDSTIGPGGTGEVLIQLSGENMDELLKASELTKQKLREYPGAYDIQDDLALGKKELRMKLNDRGKALGLTFADLARQVRQGFYGQEIHRIQRGRDEIKVWVRFPREERDSVADFETMKIFTPLGGEVPVTEVASIETNRQLRTISRYERKRKIAVKTKLDMDRLTPEELKGELRRELPILLHQVSGVDYKFEGQDRSQMQMMNSMQKWFKVSLVVIFVIIALTFKNFPHAFMIMMVIPMGFVGAVAGHLIIPLINPRFDRMDMTMLSIGGVVGLAGIVVNDSIVMIDTIKRNIREGMHMEEAVYRGAVSRFRPIVLTTFTTSIGLMPLIMEQSLQAQFLIPMAGSIAFGLLVATFFTQVWLPAFFMVLNEMKRWWYLMAKGQMYDATTIEKNALPEGGFIKGVIPNWMIGWLFAMAGFAYVYLNWINPKG